MLIEDMAKFEVFLLHQLKFYLGELLLINFLFSIIRYLYYGLLLLGLALLSLKVFLYTAKYLFLFSLNSYCIYIKKFIISELNYNNHLSGNL